MSNCATESNKGLFFGMFWSIYQGSQIFGSWFGSLLFQFKFDKTSFSLLMSAIALIAAFGFIFVRKPYILGPCKD